MHFVEKEWISTGKEILIMCNNRNVITKGAASLAPGPRLKQPPSQPQDRLLPQIMIKTWTSVGPEALSPNSESQWRSSWAWARAWPSLWQVTMARDSGSPCVRTQTVRGSGSESAASGWQWLRVKASRLITRGLCCRDVVLDPSSCGQPWSWGHVPVAEHIWYTYICHSLALAALILRPALVLRPCACRRTYMIYVHISFSCQCKGACSYIVACTSM